MNLEQDNIMKFQENQNKFMKEALKEAKKAYLKGEVPVGAVIVANGKIIARAHNNREEKQQVSGHAEMIVIKKAANKLKTWRLEDLELYVTLEPCPMCAGAIIQSRIKTVYYGAKDLKSGVASSIMNLFDYPFNHSVNVVGGILEQESSQLLKDFFKELRK